MWFHLLALPSVQNNYLIKTDTQPTFTYLAPSICECKDVCDVVCGKGIQFLVLADQVVVHLFICRFEVIHIWLIRSRTG